MRQDNLIFLILLVGVAMVMGSTFAIVSSLDTYKSHQADITAGIDSHPQPVAGGSAKDLPAANGSASVGIDRQGGEDTSVTLSPAETREVKRMLNELGHAGPTLSESLKSFQKEHLITSTGILDGITLDSIISQLSLTKARSF